MTDHFALLNEPRRPWLDPDGLKQKFLALSAQYHPDRVQERNEQEKGAAQHRYTELNAAYNCLRHPKDRLLHLLELERGAKPGQVENIPPGLMDIFLEVSQMCRQADAFLREKTSVTSPLLQVQLFERAQQWTENLTRLKAAIDLRQGKLVDELKELDSIWQNPGSSEPSAREVVLQQLEQIYRLFSYFTRWASQIQERIVQLSF